jgi:hypothetical protein
MATVDLAGPSFGERVSIAAACEFRISINVYNIYSISRLNEDFFYTLVHPDMSPLFQGAVANW